MFSCQIPTTQSEMHRASSPFAQAAIGKGKELGPVENAIEYSIFAGDFAGDVTHPGNGSGHINRGSVGVPLHLCLVDSCPDSEQIT